MSWNPFRRKREDGTDYEEFRTPPFVPTRQPFKWDLGGPRRKTPDPKEVYRREMQQRLNANPDMFNPPQGAHPPLGAQPARPAGVPANAHFDDNPFGGEWIGPAPTQKPEYTQRVNPFVRAQQRQPEPQQPAPVMGAMPARPTYDTTLSPTEEQQFKTWKQQYAPNDSGADYDLRGAFKAGLKPDPKTGHWPDTFKKPNHPTFSNQSQYATGADAARAGSWNGDQFVPPTASTAPTLPKDVPPEGMGGKAPTSPFSRRLNRPMDTVEEDEQRLRELEDKPEGFWKRLGVAATQGLRAATDQPITPIATRRDRDILKFQNRIKRGLDEQGRMSQIDSREAAMQAQQERLNQGADRLAQSQKAADLRAKQAEANTLNRYYSGQTDFDPDDPANAPFVARWEKMFGFKPAKNVRGSQLQYRVGYDADGNPVAEVLHKGTGETTQQQGSKIVSTDPQLNRQQTATIAATNEQGRNQRSVAGITSREKIAQMPPRGGVKGGGVKVNATHQKAAGELWQKTLSPKNAELEANDAEIRRLNAMTDDEAKRAYEGRGKWNTNETIKNQRLKQLGQDRDDLRREIRAAVEGAGVLNSGVDFQVDDLGRAKMSQRQASDLDNPIVGRPTGRTEDPKVRAFANEFFKGNYAKALAEIERQRKQK